MAIGSGKPKPAKASTAKALGGAMRGGPRQSRMGRTVKKAPVNRSAATSQAVIACAVEKRETRWKPTHTNSSSTAQAQPTIRSRRRPWSRCHTRGSS